MKSVKLLSACALFLLIGTALFAQNQTITENVTRHLTFLASDEMRGRKTRSPEAQIAAEYIYTEFTAMGYEAEFVPFDKGRRQNVVATIPSKNGRYIIVGAHYDGVGMNFGTVRNAADDNASGTSCLIELARILKNETLEYGVIFVAYDGEEDGLNGSKFHASTVNPDDIVLMMSIDMVGHLKDEGRLIYEGTGTFGNGALLIEESLIPGITARIYPTAQNTGLLTDTYYYDMKGIPVLNIFTGEETSNYHLPTDDIETLDIPGIALITEHLALLVKNVQEGLEPTETSLYGETDCRFGISMTKASDIGGRNLDLNFISMIPVGHSPYTGTIYFRPEIGFSMTDAVQESTMTNLTGVTVPLQLAFSTKIDKLEMLLPIGAYYTATWAQDGKLNQDAGLLYGCEFLVYNNCMNAFNHFSFGLQVKFPFENLFTDNSVKFGNIYASSLKFTFWF